jgi:signal transduction histidine kinase
MESREPGRQDPDRGRYGPRGLPLTHNLRLGDRFAIHAVVRTALAFVIIVGAVVGRDIVGIQDLYVLPLVLLGVVMLLYNALAWYRTRPLLRPDAPPKDPARLLRTLYLLIVLDYIMLTTAIWFVGGTRSPFLPFYLIHVILSCLLLSRKAAIAFHWLAFGMLALLVVGEWSGVFPPPHMPTGAVAGTGPLDGRYAATVLVVYGVLFASTAFLLLGLTRTLRNSERQLRGANDELTRLSTMRRDFLRIALHNLQSPIGVVTMFLGNLKAGLAGKITDQQAEWVQRSLDRLAGVKSFMRDLQMLSTLESGQLDTRTEEIDVAQLLADIVAENQDLAEHQGHSLTLEVPLSLPQVRGVPLLLREAAVNYVTNAVKYTPPGGNIVVRARSTPPMVRVEVEDDGVGISEEDQRRLFGEFVRLRHKDSAVSKAKGSGLGLTIVRHVAQAHGGRVGVESKLGTGSTFYLELPAVEPPPSDATR